MDWPAHKNIGHTAAPADLPLPPLGSDVEYGGPTGQERRRGYEGLVSDWLEEAKPGAFFSRDGGNIYKRAHKAFTTYQSAALDHANTIDDFEVALSRLGHRSGVFVHRFEETWILLLPTGKRAAKPVPAKSLDMAFKSLIGEGSLSAEDMDSLLDVLASHEVAPAD